MVSTLLFLSAVALGVTPVASVQRFQAEHPVAKVRLSEQGHVAVAVKLDVPALAAEPVASALRYLETEGSAFGVSPSDQLVPTTQVARGTFGTVVFERFVEGLPVIGGHVAVMVTAAGGIHAVTSSGPLPEVGARFALSEQQAVAAALARLPGQQVSVKKGWTVRADATGKATLHPVYLVGVVAQIPYRSHRFPVDGVTGQLGAALPMIQQAKGSVYRISPSKPYATTTPPASCPTVTDGKHVKHTYCAPVEEVTLEGLAGDGTLTGSPIPHVGRTTIYNCQGSDEYTPTACLQTLKANAQGNFVPPSTNDYTRNEKDSMSELMAYYQIDKQSRFLDSLDPNFVGLPLIPGYTNAYGPSPLGLPRPARFDNAFYDPQNKIMVFGQGSSIDFAYDGEVVYHEMTHAACGAIGDAQHVDTALFPFAHRRGLMVDPLSLNEGNADAFAFMSPGVGDAQLGEFDATGEMRLFFGLLRIPLGPNGYIRDLGPRFFKTCQGSGSPGNPGRVGEAHDDGEIWGEFAYEVYQGLKGLENAIPPGARYDSPAAPAMFSALQSVIAAPADQQTFSTFADLLESNVRVRYGQKAGDYVRCVANRRDLDGCDRQVVTVYSGEGPTNDQYVKTGWKAFYYSKAEAYANKPPPGFEGVPAGHQWKITVPAGATELVLNICDVSPGGLLGGEGGNGTLIIQKGRPVEFDVTGSGITADWVFPARASWSAPYGNCGGGDEPERTQVRITRYGCVGCLTKSTHSQDKLVPGDWYVLAANMGASASFANFKAVVHGPNVPGRPLSYTPSCSLNDPTPAPDGGVEPFPTPDGGAGSGGGGGGTGTGSGGGTGSGSGGGTGSGAENGTGSGGGSGAGSSFGGPNEAGGPPGCGCTSTSALGALAPLAMLGLASALRRRRRS